MNQNNLKIYSSKFLPNKPVEPPSTKRFIRNYPRKELIPHKPKIDLTSENINRRERYRELSNKKLAVKKERIEINNKQFPLRESNYLKTKVFTKSNKIDFDKTHVFHFNNEKIYAEKYKSLPSIYKYNKIYL